MARKLKETSIMELYQHILLNKLFSCGLMLSVIDGYAESDTWWVECLSFQPTGLLIYYNVSDLSINA